MNKFDHEYNFTILNSLIKKETQFELGDVFPSILNKIRCNSISEYFPTIHLQFINKSNVPPNNIQNKFTLLSNIRNSCYIDCVLVSLLFVPNNFIDTFILTKNIFLDTCRVSENRRKHIIEIQDELRVITTNMRTNVPYNCTTLRNCIYTCGSEPFSPFWKGNMEDVCEFLLYIEMLFLPTIALIEDTHKSVVINITDMSITSLHLYGAKIVYTPYLIFFITRNNMNTMDFSPITPTCTIETVNQILYLHSIIIYIRNHYISFIKVNNNWFLYDDMKSKCHYIGSYEVMMATYSITNLCVLCFYS